VQNASLASGWSTVARDSKCRDAGIGTALEWHDSEWHSVSANGRPRIAETDISYSSCGKGMSNFGGGIANGGRVECCRQPARARCIRLGGSGTGSRAPKMCRRWCRANWVLSNDLLGYLVQCPFTKGGHIAKSSITQTEQSRWFRAPTCAQSGVRGLEVDELTKLAELLRRPPSTEVPRRLPAFRALWTLGDV
jgi:hypothetical protein